MKAMTRFSLSVGLAMSTLLSSSAWAVDTPIQPKVMLITMFAPEAQNWIDRLELKQEVRVPGLSAEYPNVRCNTRQVCLMVTGMGQTNAAASTLALALSPKFDLRKSYFLIAGIAGISPHHRHHRVGTLSGGIRHPVGAGFPGRAERLADRLPGHQHQRPERKAAAGLQD